MPETEPDANFVVPAGRGRILDLLTGDLGEGFSIVSIDEGATSTITLIDANNGEIGYLPDDGFLGRAEFGYVIADQAGNTRDVDVFVDVVPLGGGTAGADFLDGLEGNDRLVGGGGNDVMIGGVGNDTLEAGADVGVLDGGAGEDQVISGNGVLQGIRIDLGNGFVARIGFDGTATVSGIESVDGGGGNDEISGSEADNMLQGLDGNDVTSARQGRNMVMGGAGDDTLSGGGSNDTLDGGAGDDRLIGGSGFDIADYSSAADAVVINLKEGTVTTAGGDTDTLLQIEAAMGSCFDHSISGDAAPNQFSCGMGNDTLNGFNEADELIADGGDDVLIGGPGADRLMPMTDDMTDSVTYRYEGVFDGHEVTGNISTLAALGAAVAEAEAAATAAGVPFDPETFQIGVMIEGFVSGVDIIHFDPACFDPTTQVRTLTRAHDGTNSGFAGGAAVVVDSAGYLVYDADVSAAGYTVVANLGDEQVAFADVSFAAV